MINDEIEEILNQLEKVKDSVGAFIGIDNKGAQILLDYITNLQQELEKRNAYIKYLEEYNPKYYKGEKFYGEDYKSRWEKATNELFELKDMIYKPETRDENIPIQQKISSIIKQLNGRSDE